MGAEDDPVEVDQLELDVLLGHGEVEEAVHGACMAPRGRLGRDAAASARDETSHASQVAGVVEDHLRVRVAGDEQVQAELLMELLVPVRLVPAVEVRDGDLPVGGGLLEFLLHPHLLLLPELRHEVEALLRRSGATVRGARGAGRVVHLAADVVLRIDVSRMGILRVGVKHEDVNDEALVGEPHLLHEVLPGHDPAVALPCVSDLLVPSVVELAPAVVVVP
mmetsp:Transcript_72047/g.198792  ORF Transcript_72047/g.198792 Transcript_72047/m.198792 type:complete len:221 (+) Transcript_72047:296-958(+)